jgi:hypothetical protein
LHARLRAMRRTLRPAHAIASGDHSLELPLILS